MSGLNKYYDLKLSNFLADPIKLRLIKKYKYNNVRLLT